jgi:hypothetical protein
MDAQAVRKAAQEKIIDENFKKAVDKEIARLKWWQERPWRRFFPWRIRNPFERIE